MLFRIHPSRIASNAASQPCHVTNLNYLNQICLISIGGHGCSTRGPPMAMNGIPKTFLVTFPTEGQVLNIHGHRWGRWN